MGNNKKAAVCFAAADIFSVIFFSTVAGTEGGDPIAATAIAAIAFAVLCADMIRAGLSDRFALTRIAVMTAAVFANYAFGIAAGTNLFADSLNIAGVVVLDAAYAIDAALTVYVAFTPGVVKQPGRKERTMRIAAVTVGSIGLVAMTVAGAVCAAVPTYASTNVVNMTAVTVALCAAFLSLTVYGARKLRPSKAVFSAAAFLCVVSVTPYAVIEGAAYGDVNRAESSFENAFGSVGYYGDMSPYDFSTEFTGISTYGYRLERDKVYFEGNGAEDGITLRYDAYYPSGESKGVLVNLHGSGGDKDIGNYAHRNKYFASAGYTVFDIQYGDRNETGTGTIPWYDGVLEWVESHLYHLDEFIKYASVSEKSADWSNLFLTGVSMGGTQISRYALSYDNSLDSLNGVILRGIIPIYPGYSPDDEGILDCLDGVTENSVPCLVVMGDRDVVVRPEAADEYKSAYENAGNPYCAQVKVSYAGHSCDYFMAGRSNQLIAYYTELFMETLRI